MSLTLTVLGAWIAALAGSVIASPAALSPFFSIGETRNAIRPGPAHLSARISSKLAGRALSGRSVLQADDPCAEYFPVEQGTLIPKSCLPADYDINWVPPPHCPALADIPASGFIQSECFPPPPPPPDAAPEDPWINPADCPAEPWLLGDAPVSVECFPPVPPDYIPPDGCPVFIDDTILEIPGRCFPRAPEAYNSWEAGVWVEPDFCEYYDAYYYGLGPDDLIPAECVPPPPQWWVPPADCPAPSPGTLVPLRCIPPGEFVQPESQVFAPGGGFEFAPPCGGPDQPPCFECGGPGQPPCEKCGGPGEPPCECGGEGQPPCGDCGGPDQPPCDFTGKLVDRCFTTGERG